MIKTGRPDREENVRVTFVLPADQPAGRVSVVGDFNDWNPYAHPLRRRTNGTRSAIVRIPAGTKMHFRYLGEDGLWFDDDTAGHRDAYGAILTV